MRQARSGAICLIALLSALPPSQYHGIARLIPHNERLDKSESPNEVILTPRRSPDFICGAAIMSNLVSSIPNCLKPEYSCPKCQKLIRRNVVKPHQNSCQGWDDLPSRSVSIAVGLKGHFPLLDFRTREMHLSAICLRANNSFCTSASGGSMSMSMSARSVCRQGREGRSLTTAA